MCIIACIAGHFTLPSSHERVRKCTSHVSHESAGDQSIRKDITYVTEMCTLPALQKCMKIMHESELFVCVLKTENIR